MALQLALLASCSDGGKPNEKITQHYCAIAANPNVGMIITEHSYVDPQGKADPHQISFADDSVIDAQKAMVKSIRNVRPDICLLAQINHAGANTPWIPEIRNESFDRVSPIIYFQEQPTAV